MIFAQRYQVIMSQFSNYDDELDCNLPRPRGHEWFSKKIEQLGRDAGTNLRVTWAPDVRRILWGAEHRYYACLPGGGRRTARHTGWFVGHFEGPLDDLNFVREQKLRADRYPGYEPTGTHLLPNGKWLAPEIETLEIVKPRWVVEEKLHDSEKEQHNALRYEWVDGLLVDALGPYPEEGKWVLRHVVAHHFIVCCNLANDAHHLCWGQGRDPNQSDVEEIQAQIAGRDSLPKLHALGERPTGAEVSRETQKTLDEIALGEQKQGDLYHEMFKDAIQPTVTARLTPMSWGGPLQKQIREMLKEKH